MRTAAIYARYSTEEQRPTSIEDQVRACRELAARKGFTVEDKWVFSDSAVSGASKGRAKRASYTQMLDAIEAREIDVVFVDEVSRVARNYLDGAKIIDQVDRTGLRIVTGDDIDSEDKNWQLLWSFKLMSAVQQNQSTSSEVVRGMVGQLERGYQIAQAPFGYFAVRLKADDGREIGTIWKPDAINADIVIEMYRWRYEGKSFLAIAKKLNEENIQCPGHKRCKGPTYWRPATVARILSNTIYKGLFVWNGSTHTRAKARKKRQTVKVRLYERPALRFVSDEVWAACNPSAGQEKIRGGGKHAFSGIIKCGYCNSRLAIGGGATGYHASCPQCEQAKIVNNAQYFIGYTSLSAIKQALKWALKQMFTGPFHAQFRERLRARLTEGPAREEAELENRLAELSATLDRLQRLLHDPRTPEEWLKEQLVVVSTEVESKKRQLKSLRERSSHVTEEAVELQVGIDPLPMLDKLLDGEPEVYKVRAVLQRLISRFQLVSREGRGHSVFELEFRPGVFVAELCDSVVIDATTVAFRIDVVTTARRPVSWEVDGFRI